GPRHPRPSGRRRGPDRRPDPQRRVAPQRGAARGGQAGGETMTPASWPREEPLAERLLVIDPRAATVADRRGGDLALLVRTRSPVQYAYHRAPLPLWSVQNGYAIRPWAAEQPSAGRPLRFELLLALRARGVEIATLTHAAGLSSTGDVAIDAALPLPERYEIPA